jgi:hypothetical protein
MKITHLLLLGALPLLFTACGGDSSASDSPAASEPAPREISGPTVMLTTEIPSEVIEGTPMPIQVPNLEQAPNQAPTLQVPEGTKLLSIGKPVTSSDDFPLIGDLNFLTDGEKQGGEGYFVELMDGLQWVQIDLEAPAAIDAVWVWHFHSQARAYHDVIVQVSNDPEFKEGVTTLFNNDYDDSSAMGRGSDHPYVDSRFGKLIDGRGTSAQFVRLYSRGNTSNDLNHYIEVEVWGR